MIKDQKDDMIIMLKRKNAELDEQVKILAKQNGEFKKGDSLAENKIKALEEMHAQKIKTLLKSIQILKKEVQKEKFEKKDNIRAQKIEALNRDIQYCEMAINALRKLVNQEDKCDQAIKQELDKGPKRIRVASREELKMDINKYKNMSLKLLEILKQNGIKQPSWFKIDQAAGSGLKEEKNPLGGFDINNMSAAQSVVGDGKDVGGSGDGDLGLDEQALLEENNRMQDIISKLNIELKEKNEKLLELLDDIEEIKIQVYSRDKSIELQQKQIEDLLEELRDSKTMDNDIKILAAKKFQMEEENIRLRKELDERYIIGQDRKNVESEMSTQISALSENVKKLSEQLNQAIELNKALEAKIKTAENSYKDDSYAKQKKIDELTREVLNQKKRADDYESRLQGADSLAQGAISKKEEDLDAYRRQLIEFEKIIKQKEDQISELQTKIISLSHEVTEKDMEIEFYSTSIEELRGELAKAQSAANSGQGGAANAQLNSGQSVDINEYNSLKAKYRLLMRKEVELVEEIDALKQQHLEENNARSVKNILDRSKSRGRQEGNPIASNGFERAGMGASQQASFNLGQQKPPKGQQ